MSFNVAGAVEVPLEVFGSLVTEMSPSDLPSGVSPDNQDVAYLPGSVFSRAGLAKVFDAAFPAGGPEGQIPTLTYGKSFVTPTGDIKNLYLDSNGVLWVEDFSNSPGVSTKLLDSTPGSYAKSVTAFGREYIAISDGLHGADVPLQYDGTNLDRMTQDGPGAPPQVISLALPSVAMALGGTPPTLTISECDPANEQPGGGYFTAINVFTAASVADLAVGNTVTISGNASAPMNGTWGITQIYPTSGTSLIVVSAYLAPGTVFGLGGTLAATGGVTMLRQNNAVTVTTASDHHLQTGYQAQITGVPAASVGGGIASIVIDNENLPGLATVTTNSAHGLAPGISVSITGVTGTSVGGGISTIARSGQIVTVTTTSAHGLTPGASVTIAGVTDASFNTTAIVAEVISLTGFVYAQADTDSTSSGGTVTLNWPVPDAPTPTYFEVLAAPSATAFQIQVNYADGSWSTGAVSYDWTGTFFVLSVPTSTSFTYQQYGPNASSSTVGAVTPYGQAAPGIHQCQVLFLTRQGALTAPSPPVQFVANGGQYLSVANIPIGPSNVVARILAFTGAEGGYFFYIPVPGQVNGQVVSTATQINDNTTESVLLDFSDNTLYSALGISIPGNNLANQIVLDGALGFGYYASRLLAYGQRNRIQNLLNMGFDGGYLPSASTVPTGWNAGDPGGGSAGQLVPGRFGGAWQISVTPGANRGVLSQGFCRDAYGAPIGQAHTPYLLRCWLKLSAAAADVEFNVLMASASGGFSATASIPGSEMSTSGSWLEVAINALTSIPDDTFFAIYATSTASTVTLTVDELSLLYADAPYLDTELYASYANNPEGFDGVSGLFGPATDTRKVMDFGVIRDTLYLFTQDPAGRLHETSSGITEPAGWTVAEVGANCGTLSAFSLTKSQADDASGSGGEEWLAWASSSGARLFGGDEPWKISQEIAPDWNGDEQVGLLGINFAAAATIWALNDPVGRVIYFGVPSLDAGGPATAPNRILPVNYRELETPYQIAMSAPVHTSFSGRLIATDNTRKWTRWTLPMNGAARMYRAAGKLSTVFFAGNGQTPGVAAGHGNVYTLSAAKLTDDDYGQIGSYWTTYFFVNHEQEMMLQLGAHRKMLAYLMAFVSGVGTVTITPLCDTLGNPWPLTVTRPLAANPTFDMEWAGGSATAQRMAFQIASAPLAGQTDNSFNLDKLIAVLKPVKHLPVRGAAT
ncbi:MAG: hypothetical protein ACRD19_06035 [Terriglobia bacterium]